MLPLTIVPSLPAASWEVLERALTQLSGIVREFQVDIVDGQFVPHTAWPFTESDPTAALQSLVPWADTFALEIDCMVQEPLQYFDTLVAFGVCRFIVHMGSTEDYASIFAHRNAVGYQLGFALTADTPLAVLTPYLPEVDFVQLMGIKHVGAQGQPFDDRIIEHAHSLRTAYPELSIAVDGGVHKDTIPRLLAAGVNRFAPGSAIIGASDPGTAYRELCALVGCV